MSLLNYIKEKGFELTKGREDDYSTMVEYGTYGRYTHKDGRCIYWGLNEKGRPPTLITPRPRILKMEKKGYLSGEYRDDNMFLCLQKETPEDIFKAMFDRSIVFNYL